MTAQKWQQPWLGAVTCAVALGCSQAYPVATPRGGADVRLVIAQGLPHLDGAALKATLVEVSYAPGGSSPPHRHPCPVIGYVVAGALRSQVSGGAPVVYRAGESFYEAPGGVHVMSANASAREPVRFLAYFVCDRETPLSVAADSGTGRGVRP